MLLLLYYDEIFEINIFRSTRLLMYLYKGPDVDAQSLRKISHKKFTFSLISKKNIKITPNALKHCTRAD